MPLRRRFARRRAKKPTTAVKKITKSVLATMSRRIETKYTGQYYTSVAVPQATAPLNYDLFVNCAVNANDVNGRVGDKLNATGLFFNIGFSPETSPTTVQIPCFFRILIVRHNDSGSVGLSNVLQQTIAGMTSITSPYKNDNEGRLKVIYDRVMSTNDYMAIPLIRRKIRFKNMPVHFDAGSTGSPVKNGLRLYIFTNEVDASYNIPQINVYWRVFYKDA